MSSFDALLAQAHRLLDQRQDPFDDDVFCARLVKCPEAMEEVAQLRAVLLQVEQSGRQNKRRPTLWWLSGLAAAALLMFLLPLSEREPLQVESPGSIPVPSQSAVMNFRVKTESTYLNPNRGSNQFRVAVVASRVSS